MEQLQNDCKRNVVQSTNQKVLEEICSNVISEGMNCLNCRYTGAIEKCSVCVGNSEWKLDK